VAGIAKEALHSYIQELFGVGVNSADCPHNGLPYMSALDCWLRSAQFLVKSYAGGALTGYYGYLNGYLMAVFTPFKPYSNPILTPF